VSRATDPQTAGVEEPSTSPVVPAGLDAAGEPALGTAGLSEREREQLDQGARRARLLDRELAHELDRPAPAGRPAAGSYLQELGRRPSLPPALERDLVVRAQQGSASARAQLIEAFLPLIASVARIYRGSGAVDRVELVQEGVVGLLRALERYDVSRGTPFWAYAAWWVRQAMQQLVAELNRPVVLSDRALRQLSRLRDANLEFLQRHGREPTASELAAATGIDASQVASLLAAEQAPRALEEPVRGDEEMIGRFGDLLVDPLAEDDYERAVAGVEVEELRQLLTALSDRERMVLRARYGIDGPERTLAEIGQMLGVSAERVRQIEQRALGKLRQAALGDGGSAGGSPPRAQTRTPRSAR
jgi:RNA polymerase primary sigma factor